MKNRLLILLAAFSTFIVVSCKKDPILTGYVYAMDVSLEYLNQNGVSLFGNNEIKLDRYNIEVTYIINGIPVNFYQIKESIEHSYVPFIYNEDDNGKKLIRLFLNNHFTENKSSTIIKLKGFTADTLYCEFFVDEYSTILKKCTVNNRLGYVYNEMITLVK